MVAAVVANGHECIALARGERRGDTEALRWVECDLHDFRFEPRMADMDVFIHLAGRAHVARRNGAQEEAEFRRDNADLTEKLARAAASHGVGRFILVSSISVYGPGAEAEGITETSPTRPGTPYGRSKLEAETRLRRIAMETGMASVIVRPALVVGAGAPGNLARLARLVASGIPLPVPRNENARSFIGLDGLTDLLILCLDHPASVNQIFVAADPGQVSTRQALEWIGEGMRRQVRTVRFPAGPMRLAAGMAGQAELYDKVYGDLRVDAAKARALLGWRPRRPLADAFRELGAGYRRSVSEP
jgi:nucleoside-diphosphate-sugar epimerase